MIDTTTGHKYQRIDQSRQWTVARDYCKNTATPQGAYLVTITSQEEQNFIVNNKLNVGNTWIGGGDINLQGVWQWLTTTEKFNFTDWAGGQPVISNGQYIFMGGNASGGKWYNQNVTGGTYGIQNFICEWGGQAYKNYVGSASLDDMNNNGYPEIATLYTNDANGQVTVQINDTNTKAIISTIVFGTPNQSFPESIAVMPNTTGTQDIAVLLINNITLKGVQEIRNPITGSLTVSIPIN